MGGPDKPGHDVPKTETAGFSLPNRHLRKDLLRTLPTRRAFEATMSTGRPLTTAAANAPCS